MRSSAAHGAKPRGEDPARSWERGRFASPALRDTLLDMGVLAETLETATTWSGLAAAQVGGHRSAHRLARRRRHQADRDVPHLARLPGRRLAVLHGHRRAEPDPAAQWRRAKDAASRAILATGGTITHHHAVGRDHHPYLEPEIGALGVEILRAVKRTLDPRGIMNPGALVV